MDVAEHALGRLGCGERRRQGAEVLLELVGCPGVHGASSFGGRPGSGRGTTVRARPSTAVAAVHRPAVHRVRLPSRWERAPDTLPKRPTCTIAPPPSLEEDP